MKKSDNAEAVKETAGKGPRYWRSLNDLMEEPEFHQFVAREFPLGASELNGVDRRKFLKIMAASFALSGAGISGCRPPEQYILPYSKQPEQVIPGVPVFYATAMPRTREHIPLVVETHQSRPTKIEGNGECDDYGGSTDLIAQASVLDLYDPDRSRFSSKGSKVLSKGQVFDVLQALEAKFSPTGGQGLAFLAEPSPSPTRKRSVEELRERFPRAHWAEYEAIPRDASERAARNLYGRSLRPVYRLAKADRILSLDADFLNSEPGHLRYAKEFASRRRVHGQGEAGRMNRLYQVESNFSVSGTMADHRLRLPVGEMNAFVSLMAAAVLEKVGGDRLLAEELKRKAEGANPDPTWIDACARDLAENGGRSLVIPGSHLGLPAQQLVIFINHLLRAEGNTVEYLELPGGPGSTISDLAVAIENRRIETLFILGGNPVYDAPADLQWRKLQKQIPEVLRYGYYFDETSLDSKYHIAATHYLESWGDGRTIDGTPVVVQPMILPLFEGIQELELLARCSGGEVTDTYELVRSNFAHLTGGKDVDRRFRRFLSDGILHGSRYRSVKPRINLARVKRMVAEADLTPRSPAWGSIEVRLSPSNTVGDGRYNNNGWLQECPDPITKLAWDNAISISPKLAPKLGYHPRRGTFRSIAARKTGNFKRGRDEAPMAKLKLNGIEIRGPLSIQPGLPDYTVVAPLGFGRRKVGQVGAGTGFDAYPLTNSNTPGYVTGAKIALTEETYSLANTQEHWSMEARAIVREANAADFQKHPDFADKMGMESHSPAVYGAAEGWNLQEQVARQPRGNSLYDTPVFGGAQQWGMNIDLNTCTGCNACVIACQSENNIPIVGKDQVMRGREMHWIRLDRYYSSGDTDENKYEIPADPQVSLMPMLCQHCEMAPCEQVCPVNATVHDEGGLNVMAYNRCVGTRYCANNCPYKVRRFNFFDWNRRSRDHFYEGPLGPKGMPELQKMQKNPDVTIRMRGVMEKCTYCQQRIEQAKIAQKVKARDSADVKIPDGVIRTACEQVCPTDSIVFGDVQDPQSAVSKLKTSDRDYSVLGYLNTRPRTTYLARLRNPNPEMPDFHDQPLSRIEYEKKFGHGEGHGNGQGGPEGAEDAAHGNGERGHSTSGRRGEQEGHRS